MAETRSDQEQKTQGTQSGTQSSSSQKQLAPGRQQRTDVTRRSSLDYGAGPFEMMRRLTEQMFGPGIRGLAPAVTETWSPSIEVFERDGKLIVRADLPGMTKDDVRVEVQDNNLVIEGERREERKEDREGYFVTERSYGRFLRVVPLPDGVNPDTAHARFRDGVLELEMDAPKNQSRGRSIAIEESQEKPAERSSRS